MAHYSETLRNEQTQAPIVGAYVSVIVNGTNALATITGQSGNPFVTPADGAIEFDVADGLYDLEYRYGGRKIGEDRFVQIGAPPPLPASILVALADPGGAALVGTKAPGAGSIATTQAAVNARTVWVEDYGAVGDGATDCAAFIEAAFTACPTGGTVKFAGGTYIAQRQINLAKSNITIDGQGATIKAKATASFEYMMSGTSLSNVTLRNILFDINGPNRIGVQAVRLCGLALFFGESLKLEDIETTNARGYFALDGGGAPLMGSPLPGFGIGLGGCNNTTVVNPYCHDSGVIGFAADGLFCSGDNISVVNPRMLRCTDTGVVLENCNNSSSVGGWADYCSAGAAISNATNFPKAGNSIEGMVIRDWNSTVTGGVQILASAGGDLLDNKVNVTLTAPTGGRGTGPAINVRRLGTGRIRSLLLSGNINTASTQGVLIDATDVKVTMSIQGTGSACIQTINDAARVVVSACSLLGGTFGVASANTSSVISQGNTMINQSSYGVFAGDTSTAASIFDEMSGQGVARIGKDGGATTSMQSRSGNAIAINDVNVIGPRGAAVANATDAASVITQLNALLARARAHGLIAP